MRRPWTHALSTLVGALAASALLGPPSPLRAGAPGGATAEQQEILDDTRAKGMAAVVCGGAWGQAAGDDSLVGGGFVDVATGAFANASGGAANFATGQSATVTGGKGNRAGGSSRTTEASERRRAAASAGRRRGGQAPREVRGGPARSWSHLTPSLGRKPG